jgi:hypothetical protein
MTKMGHKFFNYKALAIRAACVSSDWGGGLSGLKQTNQKQKEIE